VNDPIALKKQKEAYLPLPPIRKVDQTTIQANYKQIKQEVQEIVKSVMEQVLNDRAKEHLFVKK
jgi:hypothetical protein